MTGKIKVYGKAQNRTALGIASAYVVMYPQATLEDLRKAFPDTICPDSGVKQLFLPVAEAEKFNDKMNLYFAKPDEVIHAADGDVALAQVWSKSSFERMVQQGSLYGIEVAEFEKTIKGEKGGFRLEYLNGYVPPVAAPVRKGLPWWLWLILAILVVAVLYFILRPAGEPQVVEKIVEKEVVVRDTVYAQQIAEIERNFNAAQFEQGKADLNDDAKLALHDLAKVLKQAPDLRLRIEGHTSAEGDEDFNQKLSQQRAQAAVTFLVQKEGIDSARLEVAGLGSSKPLDPNNPEANRRTEFIILE